MGMIAEKLFLRLFVDGIEVPVIAGRCTFSEGQGATAQIQVIGTDQVYDIEPRAFVTLFYYDNYDHQFDPDTNERTPAKLGPKDPRRYKLLFAGELVGVTLQKNASQRHATLVCADTTNYLDFVKQHYMNFRTGGVELFEIAFLGIDNSRIKNFDVVTKGAHSNLYVWLTQSKGPDGKPNLYLGAHRVLREYFFAANDFYARAFNRLRIGDQYVGLPNDQTAAKLMELQFFEKFIKNQVGGAGGLLTARQMLEQLLNPVFHTYTTVPAPRFDRRGSAKGFSPDPTDSEDLDNQIISRSSYPDGTLNYVVIKPDTWFLAPPVCNVVFPHQYSEISFQRNYLQEPTRMFMRTSLIFTGKDSWVTERFYAPDFEEFNQLLFREGNYFDRMASVLLPHETFVGLNPIMTWQADLAAYVQKGARRDYLARLSDYLYWKYRFATRALNVSGQFNPNIIPGYPALVLDRVGSPREVPRHYLGNVQTLVHSVSQSGGHTQFTLVGARVHNETADFDQAGRSLEEITTRGTDGFLDDRYDVRRIGPEVYDPLFGCNSIIDLVDQNLFEFAGQDLAGVEGAEIDEISAQILGALTATTGSELQTAVNWLHYLYREVVANGGNVQAFTNSVTQRPKADLVEMLGFPADPDNIGPTSLNDRLQREGYDQFGFFATAVDPDAPDTNNDSFVANDTTREPRLVTTVKPAVSVEGIIVTPAQVLTSTVYRDLKKGQKGSYQLRALLEARRAKVQAYVDSLKYRGIRG